MKRGLRAVELLAGLVGVLVLLAVVAAGGLVWRLSRGPLDVTRVARELAMRRAPGLAFDNVTLSLDGRDFRIAVTGVRADGGPAVAKAAVVLEAVPLLRGALRPREITADGVNLQAMRAEDGRLTVQGFPRSSEPPRPRSARRDRLDRAIDRAILAALTHVAIHDAALTVTDAASHQTGALRDLAVDLRRDPAGALTGHAQGTLSAGDVSSAVSLDAARSPGDAPIRLHASIGAVNPSALAPLAPALARLSILDATLGVTADLALTPALDLQHATLHAESGPGRAFLPAKGGGTSPGAFASLMLDADGDAHALTLTGLRVVLSPPSASPPTTVVISGTATRGADHAMANLHVALDRGQMSDLGALWPVGVGGGARSWLVENVVAGSVHDGSFDLTLEAGAKLDDVALTAATGSMQAEDVTLYWLRPVNPLAFPHVVLTLVDPDTLTIAAAAAHQGGLIGRQVFMRIWGLSTKDQFGQIDTDIAAPIPDVFTLLRHPRLKLLSVHPIPITNVLGQSLTHLTVKLPLEAKVTMDSVDIHAASHLTDVQVPHLVMGRPLDRGVLDVDVTQQGLTISGTARLAGIGSALTVGMDFRAGPPSQVVQQATLSSRTDDRALTAAGLDTIGLLSGTVSAKLNYSERRDGQAVLQSSADLQAARLSTPLGWSKPVGPPASVAAQAILNHGRLVGFEGIHAEGPGLLVEGRSEMVDGWPSILHVEHCEIGRTSLSGTLAFPLKTGDALHVTLSGPRLDISGPLNSRTTFEPSTPATVPPGRPYKVDLQFDRVLLSEKGEGLGPVTLSANGDERRIAQGRFTSTGPEQVEVRIDPQGDTRRLTASIGDVGLLLHRLGSDLDVDQGALTLDGAFDDRRAGSPLAATMSVTRFGVHGAPVLGKVLQGMTLYGLVDALRGPGLVFDTLTMPFTLVNAVLDMQQARAFSSSLGLTAQGQVDLRRSTINLTGTIVPAYFFNTLLGRMPLVGRLFSPESGGGLFAATFSMRGPASDPAVSVNPLATLTPGALRGLFGLFD